MTRSFAGNLINIPLMYSFICNAFVSFLIYFSGYSCSSLCCIDVDECLDPPDPCPEGASCVNSIGSYHCSCRSGYSGNGRTCVNINECDLDLDKCSENAECEDTIGSYDCVCKTGYSGNGFECININECVSGLDNCSENAECKDTLGSFTCSCKLSFRHLLDTGYFVDEAETCRGK